MYQLITYNTSRFEVVTVVLEKDAVLLGCDTMSTGVALQHFKEACCLHCQGPRTGLAGQHTRLCTTDIPCAPLIASCVTPKACIHQNLEPVFYPSFQFTLLHIKVSKCQPPVSKQILQLLKIFLNKTKLLSWNN